MTLPHIEPMTPGAVPIEPGIYVYQIGPNAGLARLNYEANYPDGQLIASEFGTTWRAPMSLLRGFEWVARIYPDRIAARAKALSDLAALDGETL